ncbi:uncharacterized protein LOC113226112 [Hyposmocoma kahamanoa]|uniref:uncharacterized protein LOC113226112 n=1 Tax=Hyposmocoma kahamanoa TaxID=1477025 RepID=UPI000E6D649B|nr:uncharacterized protein LOC113226112 [Hyposmocoma kahamanoa]
MAAVDRYMAEGLVVLVPFQLPPAPPARLVPSVSAAKRRLLPLNDCMYRALQQGHSAPASAWLGALTTSEILVPVRDGTWMRLTARVAAAAAAGAPDALRVHSFWVPRLAQRDLAHVAGGTRMLARTWRAAEPSNDSALERVLFNAASVVAALPSRPLWCLARDGGARACRSRRVAAHEARVLRFDGACARPAPDCRRLVRDDALAPWREAVAAHVGRVVDGLGGEGLLVPDGRN